MQMTSSEAREEFRQQASTSRMPMAVPDAGRNTGKPLLEGKKEQTNVIIRVGRNNTAHHQSPCYNS